MLRPPVVKHCNQRIQVTLQQLAATESVTVLAASLPFTEPFAQFFLALFFVCFFFQHRNAMVLILVPAPAWLQINYIMELLPTLRS